MNKLHRNRQSVLLIPAVLLGVTILLVTAQVSGSNPTTRSTSGGVGTSTLAVPVASNQDDRAGRGTDYDPGEVYSGMFAADQLYRVVHGAERWAGSRQPARIRDVRCRDARSALERKGTWTGPLDVNGNCVSGEPTEWAVGNFLNFQAELNGDGAS